MTLIDPLLSAASETEAGEARALLVEQEKLQQALHQRLQAQLHAEVPQAPPGWMPEGFEPMQKILNTAREQLIAPYDESRLASSGRARSRDREDACPPPVSLTSGRDTPKIAGGPDAESFYPLDMKRDGIEGAAVVNALVSATGCVQRVTLVASSGAPALDEAALSYAQALAVLPAERSGSPVEGALKFRVRFQIREH